MPRATRRSTMAAKTNGAAKPEELQGDDPLQKNDVEMAEPDDEEVMETDQLNHTTGTPEDEKTEGEAKNTENAEGSGDEEAGDDEEGDDKDKDKLHKSLFIKVIGFKRQEKLEEETKLFHKYFVEHIGIEAPKVQIPGPEDRWVYFELKSLEDRTKLFTEIKNKGHNWEGHRINIKSVVIRTPEDKELKRLSTEDALKILYPLNGIPYSQQLKDKHTRAKELVDEVIPRDTLSKHTKSKKYVSNIRVKDMVPMFPIEGHEYNSTIYIEENNETGEIVYGLRAISDDKESIGLVPLQQCISVPRQMALLVECFIKNLPEMGLKPYNYTKKEGDIIGVSLKMTLSARFVMTIIIPKMPKVTAVSFRQITPDGVEKNEGEEIINLEPYSVLVKKKTEDIKEKTQKFFNDEGKKFSLDSAYVVMSFPQTLKEESSTMNPVHIYGLSFIPDNLNGVLHRLTGERTRPPIDALRPILGLIETHASINSSSRIYLACPYRLVGLYFAKKCAHVTMFFSWTKENINELNMWAKSMNLNNIEFTNAKNRKSWPGDNSVAIFWQLTKPTLADRLLVAGCNTLVSISHWNKNPPVSYTEQQKKQLEAVYSKLKITQIYPIDLSPYTERIGLAVFFNGLIPFPTQHFHRETVSQPMPLLGPPMGAPNRLGPAGPFNNRPGPWSRPDPWGPPGRSQLDQVASGVMQNLQAVQQQMQAFIPSLLDSAPMRPPPANAAYNKRYRDDFSNDSWGYGKRRRDDRGNWKRNFGKGKGGGGGSGNNRKPNNFS